MKSIKKSEQFVNDIVAAIQSVVGNAPVALHEPTFDGNEWPYLKDCLDSTYVSYAGKYVDEFEAALAKYTGAKHAISVVNGTAALHIALKLAGVMPGDEVLVPALTFVATANAVTYCGAIPHFIDSEESTLGIDASRLRDYLNKIAYLNFGRLVNKITGRRISALIPMHTFGHPSDIEKLFFIAQEFKLTLIEDAAESLGSYYKGRHTGTFGLLGTLSFNGNKTITSGGGGAILTSDDSLAKRAKHLTTTAKRRHSWEFDHDEIGFNYRLPNINAALGLAQIEKLSEKLSAKRKLFSLYKNALSPLVGVTLFEEPENCLSNYWLHTMILDAKYSDLRDQILQESNRRGIATRPAWKLIPSLSPYTECPSMHINVASSLLSRIINLPSSPKLAVRL